MTRSAPWFKMYPQDYMDGTSALTWEEKGVYGDILALIYIHDGPLPDDDRWMAHALHGDLRAWRRVKAALVNKKKIKVTSAGIVNDRAMKELIARNEKTRSAQRSAGVRWVATPELSHSYDVATPELTPQVSEKVNENNARSYADASQTHMPTRCYTDTDTDKEKPPLPPFGGLAGQDQELPLPIAAQAPAKPNKPKRAPKLNVAPEYTADFNEVWDAFPKNPNASKQDAFNAWNRIPTGERASILPACKVYAAEIEDTRRKSRDGFAAVAHLSSFLNKGTFRNKTAAKASSSPASGQFEHLATLTRDEWKDRVCRLANGFWPTSELGPSPANKSCRVPRDLIRELDLADKYNEAGIAINKHHPNHPANRQHEAAP